MREFLSGQVAQLDKDLAPRRNLAEGWQSWISISGFLLRS